MPSGAAPTYVSRDISTYAVIKCRKMQKIYGVIIISVECGLLILCVGWGSTVVTTQYQKFKARDMTVFSSPYSVGFLNRLPKLHMRGVICEYIYTFMAARRDRHRHRAPTGGRHLHLHLHTYLYIPGPGPGAAMSPTPSHVKGIL